MSIVGVLLQRWRQRTESRPGAPALPPAEASRPAEAVPPAEVPRGDDRAAAEPAARPASAQDDEICRLCGRPLRDDDIVAGHAEDVVHSDCYDESLRREVR